MQPERADMNKDLGASSGSQATPGAAEEASPPIGFDPARRGALVQHAREMREALMWELPNGVGNTIDMLCDEIERLRCSAPGVA